MDLSGVLKEAWAAVEKADLPERVHEVAFREVIRIIAPAAEAADPADSDNSNERKAKPAAPARGGGNGSKSRGGGGKPSGQEGDIDVSEEDLLTKVAEATATERAKLESLVHLDGAVLKMSLPGIKLGENNAEKTRVVAQMLSIVRGFGVDEDGTSVELVRAEVQRLKCYDQANFMKQLATLSPSFVLTGNGPNKQLRPKPAGIKAFPALVDRLLDVS
ncbi:hypothetical protein [Promicromonospora panici]|uniref:hypothetical protein n=1 Tax=Promicromonospora panici TaxID=2219658 RepID=UPI00101C38DF|nr:hypothetical protein [Promicromonospora panici]